MSSSLLDKQALLDQVVRSLEENLRQLGSGYSAARQAVLDTPHVMKSKREVSGIEALARIIRERGSRTMRA